MGSISFDGVDPFGLIPVGTYTLELIKVEGGVTKEKELKKVDLRWAVAEGPFKKRMIFDLVIADATASQQNLGRLLSLLIALHGGADKNPYAKSFDEDKREDIFQGLLGRFVTAKVGKREDGNYAPKNNILQYDVFKGEPPQSTGMVGASHHDMPAEGINLDDINLGEIDSGEIDIGDDGAIRSSK